VSGPAIFSLLWSRNLRVLPAFVRRRPGTTILSLDGWISKEWQARIVEAGGAVVCVDAMLSVEERQALHAVLTDKEQALQAALREPAWQARWQAAPVAPERLGEILSSVAAAQLPELLPLAAALEKAASRYALQLILLNEDMTARPRVLIDWARRRSIPTLHLSHGVELGEPYTVHAELNADVTAVFGERGIEGYADLGLDTSSLRITGNPAWDDYPALARRRDEIRAELTMHYGLTPRLPIVVFGTTWAANMTAFSDEAIHGKTLRLFLAAARALLQSGLALQLIIKDHPGAPRDGAERVRKLFAEYELPESSVRYLGGDPTNWVLSADVLISMQSNLSIEAMLAGTPAIDLLTEIGMWLGPCYGADSGVLEIEAPQLLDTVRALLYDDTLRKKQLAAMARAVVRHNIGVDGRSTERFVALMEEMIDARRLQAERTIDSANRLPRSAEKAARKAG
jgi:O-antigen biosynthesis protein